MSSSELSIFENKIPCYLRMQFVSKLKLIFLFKLINRYNQCMYVHKTHDKTKQINTVSSKQLNVV